MTTTLTHPKGRSVTVPDETVESYTKFGWTVAGSAPVETVEVPDGDPTGDWKVAQLKAYAESNGVDLGDATKKDDILAVLTSE